MEKISVSPLKSIRNFCLGCSCDSMKDVRECNIPDCPLYAFRLGSNPNRKGIKKGFKVK
jgi:hypothetical protein